MAGYAQSQQFLSEVEETLKTIITVSEYEKVQSAMLSVISCYSVERIANSEDSVKKSQNLLKMFIDAKAVEGRSPKTTERYRYILTRFFKYEKVSAQDTTVYHIRDYFMNEKERGISDSTLASIRDVFNSFFGWLYKEGLISKNPCANVGTVKQEKKVRKPFSQVDLQKLLNSCNYIRDKAMVLFLLNTGCRVSEICGLTIENVDLIKRECVVYGKGKKERTVYFDDVTAYVLEQYLASRHFSSPSSPLFLSLSKRFFTPGGVRAMLSRIEKLSGVENVHPHRFRRTFATNMIDRGMPIQEVAVILGHDRIDTTMKYVYQSRERTKSAYDRYML